eukprot:2224916-Amphidinium_carterae.1
MLELRPEVSFRATWETDLVIMAMEVDFWVLRDLKLESGDYEEDAKLFEEKLAATACGQSSSRKMHRVATRDFVVALDHVLQVLGLRGLREFMGTETLDWHPQENLPPFLSLSLDQGSTGPCMQSWARYKAGAHMMVTWDVSHRVHNCIKGALASAGLWSHVVCTSVAFNMPFGPFQGG